MSNLEGREGKKYRTVIRYSLLNRVNAATELPQNTRRRVGRRRVDGGKFIVSTQLRLVRVRLLWEVNALNELNKTMPWQGEEAEVGRGTEGGGVDS